MLSYRTSHEFGVDSLNMMLVQRRIKRIGILLSLLLVGQGSPGLNLCVRGDGQPIAKPAYQCSPQCCPTSLSGLTDTSACRKNTRSTSTPCCEKGRSCFEISVAMIVSSRESFPNQSAFHATLGISVPILPLDAHESVGVPRAGFVRLWSSVLHPTFDGLRSTILLI